MLILAITFLASALAAFVVTPAVAGFAVRRGVYGHSRPGAPRVPRLGGVAVCIAMSAGVVFAAPAAARAGALGGADPYRFFAGVLLAGWLLFAAGLVDDLRHLRPATKLLAQCLASLVAYAVGFRVEELSFGGTPIELGLLSLPITVLWIVGVTNAFNLIDGLDGLATGVALVALASTLAVSLSLGNGEVALVCAALGGALLGFLRYNLRPARIFLGDSGSLLVGFMLAVLSVHGSTKSATAVLAVIPVLVLALPLLDTALSIVRRWLRGKPVFGADEHHLHHRLLAIGLTHTRAVILLYLVAAALATVAVVVAFAPPTVVTVTAFVGAAASVVLLLFGIYRLGYHEFVEAGMAVTTGMARLRGSIRDQIHARDVAQVLVLAETEEHLRAILSDNAAPLGFLDLAFCRENAPDRARPSLPPAVARRACRLDVPVPLDGEDADDPWVLRAWAEPAPDGRLFGSHRAVQVLAEAVRQWRRDRADGVPSVFPRPTLVARRRAPLPRAVPAEGQTSAA